MSSKVQKPLSSPPSQPENVKTVEHEVKQSFALPSKVREDADTWTEVTKGSRSTRRGLRAKLALSESIEKSYSTPSPPSGRMSSLSPSPESKMSSAIKDWAKVKANDEKSQKEIASLKEQSNNLQAQVVSLNATLERLMAMLAGTSVNIPKGIQSPERSPSPSVVGTPKGSYKDSVGRKSPSPLRDGSDPSSTNSSRSGSTDSSPNGSLAASPKQNDVDSDREAHASGSPVAKFHLPETTTTSPPSVVPATANKKDTPIPTPTPAASKPTPSSPKTVPKKSATPMPLKPMPKKSTPPKSKSKKSSPPTSPPSSVTSSPESTTEKKASLALNIALKAEKETKAIAANYQSVKSVTDNFVKLGTSNYETWRRKWGQESKTLGWSEEYMSVDGPELDLNAEVDTESVHRKNAAKMVLKTIDAVEHEPWLRDTDPTNPQAIFRRIHLKFRGTDTIAVSSQIESQLLTMSMKSTRLDVVAYGSAIVENLRKLKEMGTPMCEVSFKIEQSV